MRTVGFWLPVFVISPFSLDEVDVIDDAPMLLVTVGVVITTEVVIVTNKSEGSEDALSVSSAVIYT